MYVATINHEFGILHETFEREPTLSEAKKALYEKYNFLKKITNVEIKEATEEDFADMAIENISRL